MEGGEGESSEEVGAGRLRCWTEHQTCGARPAKPSRRLLGSTDLLPFNLLGPANWTALETMDHSSPPRPALFLSLMLKEPISRFSQLFSNFWVAHSHTTASRTSRSLLI
jgi:hypothetical protein